MNAIDGYRYKWKYRDEERPEGCCYDCRLKYTEFPDFMIPDELWERINPTYHEGAGILCPTCIANRLNYLGLWREFGAFDIKPPEVPETEWREQKLKNGWAQYRIDKLEKVE